MDSVIHPSGQVRRIDALPRGVLVDLDGTMVDTAPDLCAAAALMLADLGRPALSQATVAGFIGNGVPTLVARVLAAAGLVGSVDQATAETLFTHHYGQTNGRHGSVYPGTQDGIAALWDAGYRLACVTNKPVEFAEALLRKTGLRRYFDALVGGDTLTAMKPSPEPLLHACQLLGVEPQRAIMVGDSAVDVAAASAAGMPVWLVGHGYPGVAAPAGGAFVIDSLDQLPTRLAGVQAQTTRSAGLGGARCAPYNV